MYKCEKCKIEFENKGGFVIHIKKCDLDEDIINLIKNDYNDNGLSFIEIKRKYNISYTHLKKILGNLRSGSESQRNVKKHNKRKYKASDETKKKLSIARTKWLLENPDKNVWRERKISYPEKIFKERLEELGLNKHYLIIRERSVFPYYIDFAFENEKVAFEIDGDQHEWGEVKIKDLEKEDKLKKEGWRIYRATAKQVLQNRDLVIQQLLEFIGDKKTEYDKCGIILYNGKYKESKRKIKEEKILNNGLSNKQLDYSIKQRKIERPPFETLLKEIDEFGYVGTGKKYGISDNSIRKWIKWYKKYHKDNK